MPMLTYTFSTAGVPTSRLAVWTTNGTVSFTAVAGLSVPNVSMSKFFAYGRFPASSAKLRSWSVSTQTLSPSRRTPKRRLEPAGLPSRLMSLPYSLPVKRESPSLNWLQKK